MGKGLTNKNIHHISPSQSQDDHSNHHKKEYYQQNLKQYKHKNYYEPKEPNIDLPSFYRSTNIDDYLTWEMKVEKLFEAHQIDHERRVTLATLSFQDSTMTWWSAYTRDLRLHNFLQIYSFLL